MLLHPSKIRLPETEEVREEFGEIEYRNGEEKIKGKHNYGLASVMYDVLNKIAVDSHLGKARDYEVDLGLKHLEHTHENDLLICDRNYPSYRWLSTIEQMGRKFIVRCSEASYKQARIMLKGVGKDSQLTTLKPCYEKMNEINKLVTNTSYFPLFKGTLTNLTIKRFGNFNLLISFVF